MIGKLKGIVDAVGEGHAIIDVNGVGYEVQASARTLRNLASGEPVSLAIETHVREDAIRLFGFTSEVERAWFRLLQTIQGVGAKVALAVLGTLSPQDLANAIALQNWAAVEQSPGVGKKLAQRIVAELKDKAPALSVAGLNVPAMAKGGRAPAADNATAEAISRTDESRLSAGAGEPGRGRRHDGAGSGSRHGQAHSPRAEGARAIAPLSKRRALRSAARRSGTGRPPRRPRRRCAARECRRGRAPRARRAPRRRSPPRSAVIALVLPASCATNTRIANSTRLSSMLRCARWARPAQPCHVGQPFPVAGERRQPDLLGGAENGDDDQNHRQYGGPDQIDELGCHGGLPSLLCLY